MSEAGQTRRAEALAEVVGALTYALLRSFEAAAAATVTAPSFALAEWQAGFAADEFERFRVLRARLDDLTDDSERAMSALRAPLEAFYASARGSDWLEWQVFHFIGDAITTDFADVVDSSLDPATSEAIRRALTGRTPQEVFALEQIETGLTEGGAEAHERVRRFAGTMVGQGLNRLRDALLASDALEVVLGEGGVKTLVLELLARHRERLERLGIDSVED